MRLNEQQQQGVVAAGHCMISACPGSGKTRVLIQRAEHLLKQNPSHRIALITFTKDAAGEISERLLKAVGSLSTDRIITGTFHAIALKQLNDARKPPLKPLTILSDAQSRILIRRAWREEAYSHPYLQIVKAIETAKATRIPPTHPNSAEARVLRRYEELLRERDAYDFSDLVTRAVDGILAATIPPLACTHLLVDEFQDVDQTQFAWVMAHKKAGIKVTVVGDDDQSIYAFRHSLGFDGMQSFAEASSAEEITLGTTYRCAREIITMANQLIRHNTNRIAKAIKTAQTAPGIVERFDFANEADEAIAAGRALMARPAHLTAAILARTNSTLNTAQIILQAEGIPHYRIGGTSLWSIGIPCMIRDLAGAFGGRGVGGIIMYMHALHCDRDLVRTISATAGETRDAARFLLDTTFWAKGLGREAHAAWAPIRTQLLGVRTALQAGNESLALARVGAMAVQASGTNKGEKIAEAACSILASMPGTLASRLNTLDRRERAESKDARDPGAIALMTLHGSKGLEFDRVWMMGLQHGTLPHKDSTVDEERRLCYVGMTRAKTHLTLSTSVEEGKASQFLTEIRLAPSYVSLKNA